MKSVGTAKYTVNFCSWVSRPGLMEWSSRQVSRWGMRQERRSGLQAPEEEALGPHQSVGRLSAELMGQVMRALLDLCIVSYPPPSTNCERFNPSDIP
jgi:hypothetical protein